MIDRDAEPGVLSAIVIAFGVCAAGGAVLGGLIVWALLR